MTFSCVVTDGLFDEFEQLAGTVTIEDVFFCDGYGEDAAVFLAFPVVIDFCFINR
jgi:hypothetical protein